MFVYDYLYKYPFLCSQECYSLETLNADAEITYRLGCMDPKVRLINQGQGVTITITKMFINMLWIEK